MPRGRLVFPFGVDLAQLDTAATAADPDTAGPLTSGYNDIYREPVLVPPSSGSARGISSRKETVIRLKAQIEPDMRDRLEMMATGNSPKTQVSMVFHYRDLEAAGVVESGTGRPKLRAPGDRLAAIRNYRTGVLIETIPAVPGLYAIEVRSLGYGLGTSRNLLLMVFEERDLSVEK